MSPIYVPGKVVLKKDGVAATDTNIREVSLLLHGNGTNGSTTITDSSLTPKTVTAIGNAQISTAQSKFGGASIAFDGNGDYLTVGGTSALPVGLENFTVELWIYNSDATWNRQVILLVNETFANDGGFQLFVTSTGVLRVARYGYAFIAEASLTALALNSWHHLAVTRNNNLFTLWVNGTSAATATSVVNYGPITNQIISATGLGALNGYIDDLRITKGVARYTANFTPPTLPFPDF
jgi:hypothetical protein